MLGCTLAFKVKIQLKYKNFAVVKMSYDTDLMKTIMELVLEAEVGFITST